MRIWRDGNDDALADGQVQFRGNILLASRFGDLLYVRRSPGANKGEHRDGQIVLQRWHFEQNWRDQVGSDAAGIFPLAKNDHKLDPAWLLSRIDTDPDFLRPAKDSPLAHGGAGGDLPAYAGAVAPIGVEPWDWNKTWKARAAKSAPAASKIGKTTTAAPAKEGNPNE